MVEPELINYIILSHLHGDHFGGIPFLIRETQITSKRITPLCIAGPAGLELRIRDAMEILFPGSSRLRQSFPLEFVELSANEQNKIGPLLVTPYHAIHTAGTEPLSLRVECDGRVISYTGDTEWTEALEDIAEEADVLICESFFFEKVIKNHLSYRTIMEHRAELRCKRLILTHMSDDMLDRIHDLDTECAEDGNQISL